MSDHALDGWLKAPRFLMTAGSEYELDVELIGEY
jgi:hypothetical protein